METTELADLETELAELQTKLNAADRADATALSVGTAEDLQVLRLLLRGDAIRVSDLARTQGASAATVSARLDRLEKRGLLTRERLPGDRRSVAAMLTDLGRAAATASLNRRLEALGQLRRPPRAQSIRVIRDAIATIDPTRPSTGPGPADSTEDRS